MPHLRLAATPTGTTIGFGTSMIIELSVRVDCSHAPPQQHILRRKWRDLVTLESVIMQQQPGARKRPVLLSTGRAISAEQRCEAVGLFFDRLLEDCHDERQPSDVLCQFLGVHTYPQLILSPASSPDRHAVAPSPAAVPPSPPPSATGSTPAVEQSPSRPFYSKLPSYAPLSCRLRRSVCGRKDRCRL